MLLPFDRTVGDYLTRMVDAVRLIAALEERLVTEVLTDLQHASTDVLRIRLCSADAADGTLPLLQGERMVKSTTELLAAAGCAVNARRAYFPASRTDEVRQFVQNLRLGQSERGSYVLTVQSRVAPELRQEQPSLFDAPEPPFERRAVTALNRALIALRDAVDAAATNFTAKVFQDAVAHGVSANLCQAVAGMTAANPQPVDQLRFAFTWARSRPFDSAPPREVGFRAEAFPIIAEAGRVLKAVAPLEDQEIQGYVVKLEQRGEGGIATVTTVLDGQARKVALPLAADDHKRATQAYDQRIEIRCRGDVTRSGNTWTLQNPGHVAFVADNDQS